MASSRPSRPRTTRSRRSDYIAQSNEAAYSRASSSITPTAAMSWPRNRATATRRSTAGQRHPWPAWQHVRGHRVERRSALLQSGLSAQDISQGRTTAPIRNICASRTRRWTAISQLAGILSWHALQQQHDAKDAGLDYEHHYGRCGLAASIFSDVRLKDNIVATGDKWHGLPVFEFDYRDVDGMELPAGRHRGVMAQDAILEYPDAVSVGNNGYLQIDYGQIARSNIQ
jgi:hypothetical protein